MDNHAEQHHRLINAFVGFSFDLKSWPDFLFKEGYKVYWIEKDFKNQNGDMVKPEIIFKSDKHKNALLLEAKSRSLDKAQIQKYKNITIDDVVVKANVAVKNYDVPFIVYKNNLDTAKRSMKDEKAPFPLISLSEGEEITLVSNLFNIKELNDVLKKPISIKGQYLPENLIPFSSDANYPDKKIEKYIIFGFSSLILQGKETSISLHNFLSNYVIRHGLYDTYPNQEKNNICKRVQPLAKKIIRNHYSDYLSIRKNGLADLEPHTYDILKTPHSGDPKDTSKEIKAFLKITKDALESLGESGKMYQSELGDIYRNIDNSDDIIL